MGHYESEIGGDNSRDVRAAEEAEALRARGYSDPIKYQGSEMAICAQHTLALSLRLHKPCGQAIFDPDQHDRYCPARATPSPEQEAVRKGDQSWSGGAASYCER